MFVFIKQYFEMGLYTKDNLATLKLGNMLTEDQYNELLGINPEATNDSQTVAVK